MATTKTITEAELKQDGPTVAEYVAAGYKASNYPPLGYVSKSTPEEVAVAVKAETDAAAAPKTEAPIVAFVTTVSDAPPLPAATGLARLNARTLAEQAAGREATAAYVTPAE